MPQQGTVVQKFDLSLCSTLDLVQLAKKATLLSGKLMGRSLAYLQQLLAARKSYSVVGHSIS